MKEISEGTASIKAYAKDIEKIADKIASLENNKRQIATAVTNLEIKYSRKEISDDEYNKAVTRYLRGRNKQDLLQEYEKEELRLLTEIRKRNSEMYKLFQEVEAEREDKVKLQVNVPKPEKNAKDIFSRKETQGYIDELKISKEKLRQIVKKERSSENIAELTQDYTVYKESKIGKFSNLIFGNISSWIVKKYPKMFTRLYESLRVSDTRVLSRTYVSLMILSGLVAFILFFTLAMVFLKSELLFNFIRAFAIGVLSFVTTITSMYYYPISVIKSRSRKIKNELPFVVIHMAAVAGSGAKPVTIFKMILDSKEYRVVSVEVKKIMNYVNLFGYSLSTALKAVAITTPSYEFRELMNGMVSSIETGGDLRNYLNEKAKEMLNTYRLDRKKYIDSLSAYSDIYTGILIAAPLLFVVTLAIMNVIGGGIGGVSADVIAKIGTYGFIPFLNIAFLLFLNIVQPGD